MAELQARREAAVRADAERADAEPAAVRVGLDHDAADGRGQELARDRDDRARACRRTQPEHAAQRHAQARGPRR